MTREKCLKIVEQTDAFYKVETEIQGYKAEMYNYRLAGYTDFKDYNAWELRGICFIYNDVLDKWNKFIALPKFFNLNQTEDYMYDDLKDNIIIRLQEKLDGSMITFVRLPNNKIAAKSKMSFISPQAQEANKILEENVNYYQFVDYMLKTNMTPIFELVGPHNQIVLSYNNTELKLLQIRNCDGLFIDTSLYIEKFKLKSAILFEKDFCDIDYLIASKKRASNIEGWVVTHKEGMYKIKTDWYMQMHGLVTDALRENLLIKTILDGNIDDILAQLDDSEKKTFIIETEKKVNYKFNYLVKSFLELREDYFRNHNNRKSFSIKYSKYKTFGLVMKTLELDINEELVEQKVKEYVLHITRDLGKAKDWLDEN